MEALMTALTAGITPTILFGALALVAPIVIVGVVVGFSKRAVSKAVRGVTNGKGSI